MDNYTINSRRLEEVAVALDDLVDDVVFVGGCTTVLLVDKAARFAVRQTDDVDVVVNVTSYVDYQRLSKKLRSKGFKEDADGPLCRWSLPRSRTKLDVMPMDDSVLGFSNRWYPKVIESGEKLKLANDKVIRVVKPTLFIATKFEAFFGRGKGDYFSHDLEDIVFLLENRSGLYKELQSEDRQIKLYIASQAEKLLNDKFYNILPGLLENRESTKEVIQLLKDISAL